MLAKNNEENQKLKKQYDPSQMHLLYYYAYYFFDR